MNFKIRFLMMLSLLTAQCTPIKVDVKPKRIIGPLPEEHYGGRWDNFLIFAIIFLVLFVITLACYVISKTWSGFLEPDQEASPEEIRRFQQQEQEANREFYQTFPMITIIILTSILFRETLSLYIFDLSDPTKNPFRTIRIYSISVLMNCIPVTVFLIYKLRSKIAEFVQTDMFRTFKNVLIGFAVTSVFFATYAVG
ncbi:hypothetical protein L5515_017679 [Caenorhabditis briggsae]|uniref:Uncharacterized protein n=1 Tax=Caenorhabditis briggsae TaxID=6238 RepID=A0AAE9F999_CAEBR|nr:hypothetical protein L5515_017679 [Caenorhabditis briggsae]